MLLVGSSVVLDWNIWSRSRRADAVERAAVLGVSVHLHYVVVPLEVAIERTAARDDSRAHRLEAEDVRHLSGLFEPPTETEGFMLHVVGELHTEP